MDAMNRERSIVGHRGHSVRTAGSVRLSSSAESFRFRKEGEIVTLLLNK